MENIKILFTVEIPRKLEKEKIKDPDFPIAVRTKLVQDAAYAFAKFTKTKQEHDEKNSGYPPVSDIKSMTLDNGITVSWDIGE